MTQIEANKINRSIIIFLDLLKQIDVNESIYLCTSTNLDSYNISNDIVDIKDLNILVVKPDEDYVFNIIFDYDLNQIKVESRCRKPSKTDSDGEEHFMLESYDNFEIYSELFKPDMYFQMTLKSVKNIIDYITNNGEILTRKNVSH